ncbi:MAG: selenide, water dikinase SelD [Desulfomonilaceae bacterium]
MGPGDLNKALCGLSIPVDPNVLTGIGGSEDAGVYKLNNDTALVQTIDFFTPIVDDPRVFGRAAASNSLSDIYAMGAKPITAMNIVCFPVKKLGIENLRLILEGGLEILKEAEVSLIGGHSVEDDEPKYGMSVLGLVHPGKIMKNDSLALGDKIVLTKAIGAGVISTAAKAKLASKESILDFEQSICALNKVASQVAVKWNILACTDVTGFGLAGHLTEMALASKCKIRVQGNSVPLLNGASNYASMGLVPAGAYANRAYYRNWVKIDASVSETIGDLMFDPQTSGGLLLGVPAQSATAFVQDMIQAGIPSAAIIGDVVDRVPEGLVEIV